MQTYNDNIASSTMETRLQKDIVIIGGGLSGLAVACGLEAAGLSYLLLEQHALPTQSGMGITLHPSGLHALSKLGVDYKELDEFATLNHLSYGTPQKNDYAQQTLGYKALPVICTLRAKLHQLLYSKINPRACLAHCAVEAISNTANGAQLQLSNSQHIHAKSLIVAGGVSQNNQPASYRQSVWRWVVATKRCANRAHEVHNGQFRLGVFPVSPTHSYIFLAAQPSTENISQQELNTLLHRFGTLGKEIANATIVTDIHFDHVASNDITWSEHPQTLNIGDAAHAISPNLGMGASLAFEDAHILVELLKSHPQHTLDNATIKQFISLRHKRVQAIKRQSDFFGSFAHLPKGAITTGKLAIMKQILKMPAFNNGEPIYQRYFKSISAFQ